MASKKRWSYSAGEWGTNRVRAFEHPTTGLLYLEFYDRGEERMGGKRRRIALGHRERELAKAKAEELAAAFRSTSSMPARELTLGKLFDNYLREVTPTKGDGKQRHDRRTAELFLRCFGPGRKPRTLSLRDWNRFIEQRKSGALRPLGSALPRPIGPQQIRYDLQWLLAVFNWGVLAGDGLGGTLLNRNPLKGLPLPKEENPVRPIITHADYEALLAVSRHINPLFELALVMANETGHRISAISNLRWSDIDFPKQAIRWRSDNDKSGFEHTTALSSLAIQALERARRERPGIGDSWVFPSTDSRRPVSRHLLRDWFNRARQAVGLPDGERFGYHALRRKFASELKNIPLVDLAQLGGWKTTQTILTCYQRPDEKTMRVALESRRRYG